MIRHWLRGIRGRFAVAALAGSIVAIAILAIGVLVVAADTFTELMREHGSSTAASEEMFGASVSRVFVVAAVVAIAASVILAVFLARRLAGPLQAIREAARRIAQGDYSARIPPRGPEEIAGLADLFNRMASSLEEQEQVERDFIANASHELRTPLTNLRGYLEALRDGVIAPSRETFELLSRRGRAAGPARRGRSTRWPRADAASGRPRGGRRRRERGRLQRRVDLAQPSFPTAPASRSPSTVMQTALRARAAADHVPPGAREPPPERGAVHAARRTRAGSRRPATRRKSPSSVTEHGPGDPAEDLPHPLGALLPGREVARRIEGRCRHRAGDRPPAGGGGRRSRRGDVARRRDAILVHAPEVGLQFARHRAA